MPVLCVPGRKPTCGSGQRRSKGLLSFRSPPTKDRSCSCRPHLAVGFDDGRLRIFDAAAAVLAGEMRHHWASVQDVAFDADGTRLYTAGEPRAQRRSFLL